MSDLNVIATAVFCASTAAVFYIVAGYPVLLSRLSARAKVRPVLKDHTPRTVSVVIAVRNGAPFLARKLESIFQSNYPRELMQITVVSDGSDDGTDEIAASFYRQGVRFLRIERSGKPSAVNLGIACSTGEILILTDVRQTLDPDGIRNLVACFGDPTVGSVSGELSIRQGLSHEEADTGLYWKYEMFMRKHMSLIDSTFGTNGPFYAVRRDLAVHIPPETLLDDVYLPLAGFFRGFRIVLEHSAKAFDYPTNLNSEFRRKVRTQAGLYQILQFYPEVLSARNRMRLHFVSGKFGRLTIPFFLLLMALSTPGLPSPWWQIALCGQLLFYGTALIDRWVPQQSVIKRVTSPVRTFVVLMAAAFMAVSVFFVPPRKLWKETKVQMVRSA